MALPRFLVGTTDAAARSCASTASTSASSSVTSTVPRCQPRHRPVVSTQAFDATTPYSTASGSQGHVLSRKASRLLRRTLQTARTHLTETQAIAMQAPQAACASLEAELRLLSERLKHLGTTPDMSLSSSDESDFDISPASTSSSGRLTQHTHATSAATTSRRPQHPPTASTATAATSFLAPSSPAFSPPSSTLDLPLTSARLPSCSQGRVLVCQGSKCQAAGSIQTLRAASAVAAGTGIEVLPSKCLGKCKLAPAVRVQGPETITQPAPARGADKRGVLYTQVTPELLFEAMQQHCRVAAEGPQMLSF